MAENNNEQPYIGSYVLESLTTGMYGESENAIREYVQNAFDAVRSAVHMKLLSDDTARISVTLSGRDQITVYDNGIGIAGTAAYKTLTSIGASKKDRQKQAGFRGIGRLAGIAFCDLLTFRTKAAGEEIESTVTFDCKTLRVGMNDGSSKLVELLQSAVRFTQTPSSFPSSHFMEVTLSGLDDAPEVFKDVDRLRMYLAETSPVPFDPAWTRGLQIGAYAKDKDWPIETAQLVLGTSALTMKPIYKLYKETYPTTGARIQSIESIEYFFDPQRQWWAWVGHSNMSGNFKDKNVHGIRVRVKNIAIDKTTIFDELFASVQRSFARFNSYYVGEVHINPALLIPNARRDGFEDNEAWRNVRTELKERLCRSLASKAYEKSTNLKKSVDTIEKNVTGTVSAVNKAIKSQDATAGHLAMTKIAELRSRIADAAEIAVPEVQVRLKAQLLQLNVAQNGLTKVLGQSDCSKAIAETLERVYTILETYLGPEEYRKIKKAVDTSFK